MQKDLLSWYRANKRDLPWRKSRDPYRIWISEVMLQQTTVAAVVPYYERFMTRFPTVKDLASATEPEVLEMWAGLGYYSRARNLHRAAGLIAKGSFPQSAEQLAELPGFGPYTSAAVASLAFNQRVGVLDGNVIRILTRVHALKTKWWQPKERKLLQDMANELAQSDSNSEVNQGMMELGATVCTAKKPLCLLCPWKKVCKSLKSDLVEKIPLAKPRQKNQIWLWEMSVAIRNNRIYLEPNSATPFLSEMYFPKGRATQLTTKPSDFDLRHSVTKYEIYVKLKDSAVRSGASSNWFELESIRKINHSSLMTKILKKLE